MVTMKATAASKRSEKRQAARDWWSLAAPNGQVVCRGRYHFVWRQGYFVGAYDTLDDAVEALEFTSKV
jgi:hypothetical protein